MEVVFEALMLDTELEQRNHKVYPAEVMTRAVDDFVARIEKNEGAIPGECQPPPDDLIMYLRPENMSHVVKHVYIQGNRVVAKVDLVGRWNELAEKGVIWSGTLRTFDMDEDGKEINVQATKPPFVVHKCSIITVDLIYREEF